jgi:hypothetical protein
MKTTDVPPLPVPKEIYLNPFTSLPFYGYTEEQMESYAASVFEVVKELKADAARYRWLADRMVHVFHPAGAGWTMDEVLVSGDRDLDETVDAMAKQQICDVAKRLQIQEPK